TSAWLCPRHRRQGHRQSGGTDLGRGDDARSSRPPGSGRGHRRGDRAGTDGTSTADHRHGWPRRYRYLRAGDRRRRCIKGQPMKILDIREKAVSIAAPMTNAYIDFSRMTCSIVALVTDVVRDGKKVIGYGFNSNGRYGQGALMRERF